MSVISLAEKTFDIRSCQSLFENLYIKGHLKENSLEKIYADPSFKELQKIKTREAIIYDEHKCDAREWSIESINNIDYVLDNVQCQREKMNGSCFCKFHHKKNETMPNGWWLGKINEKRPEPLYHPGSKNHETGKYENPIQHQWKYEISKPIENIEDTNDKETDVEVKPKKRRGRPPGSKNKKNKKTKTDPKKNKEQIITVKEESEPKPKQTFVFDYEEETDSVKYEVDGFAYSINQEGDVINPHTYEYMGQSDGNGGINFIDDDALEKHKNNVENI